MKKKIICIVGAVAILVLASLPNAFGITSTQVKLSNIDEKSDNLGFNAINIDETTIKITVNLEEFEFEKVDNIEGLFTSVKLPGYGFSYNAGQAKLPIIRRMVEIPYDSDPELLVTFDSWDYMSLEEFGLSKMIFPAQPSVEKTPDEQNMFIIDEKYYSTNSLLPENIAKIVEIGEIRSRRFALVEISPIQYNPVTGELKLMNSCEIIINLPNSDLIKTYENILRYSTTNFESMFKTVFANYG
ncbi:MAG: hypothetical protein JSU91_07850, partial [Thermoplasmatales archaeon]